jgi:hypothetical protein
MSAPTAAQDFTSTSYTGAPGAGKYSAESMWVNTLTGTMEVSRKIHRGYALIVTGINTGINEEE